jgi:hypothetical protein
MSGPERDDRGQFEPEHADGEFLEAVGRLAPAGTKEVADAVGVTRQNADQRLRRLEDVGQVTSKKIGNSLAWNLSEDEAEPSHVDPEDAFWDADAYDGEARSAGDVDDVLYGGTTTE